MQDIKLNMIFLPLPATWTGVEDEDLDTIYKIFPDTTTTTRPATYGPASDVTTTARHSNVDLDKSRRRFLAGCLMNGHVFTARLGYT